MSCSRIESLGDFREYIQFNLGAPINCIELTTDQYDTAICDAIGIFTRYMYGEAVYQDYMAFTVSAGTSAYDLSAYDEGTLEDVIDFDVSEGFHFVSDFFGDKSVPGGSFYNQSYGSGGSVSQGLGEGRLMAGIDLAMLYGKEFYNQFGRYYRTDYRQATGTLTIIPTPTQTITGLLTVYKREKSRHLYNNILLKKLAVALAMKIWGRVLKKYTVELPGGGSINGAEIYQDGVAEEEKVMEQIMGEAEQPSFFVA